VRRRTMKAREGGREEIKKCEATAGVCFFPFLPSFGGEKRKKRRRERGRRRPEKKDGARLCRANQQKIQENERVYVVCVCVWVFLCNDDKACALTFGSNGDGLGECIDEACRRVASAPLGDAPIHADRFVHIEVLRIRVAGETKDE
jgi:hypothetical protein